MKELDFLEVYNPQKNILYIKQRKVFYYKSFLIRNNNTFCISTNSMKMRILVDKNFIEIKKEPMIHHNDLVVYSEKISIYDIYSYFIFADFCFDIYCKEKNQKTKNEIIEIYKKTIEEEDLDKNNIFDIAKIRTDIFVKELTFKKNFNLIKDLKSIKIQTI